MVALRKESVDRNHDDYLKLAKFEGSLSARRAWIEISCSRCSDGPAWSLSARRAWIEIPFDSATPEGKRVSLSARRAWIEIVP